MKKLLTFGLILAGLSSFKADDRCSQSPLDFKHISYVADPLNHKLAFFWKDENGTNYKNFENLREVLKGQRKSLVFAMNGGMYTKELSPLGLYIEKGKVLSKLNTTKTAHGNFYLQPNGVFYLNKDGSPVICTTPNFELHEDIDYATQSGPMLVIDGTIHPAFRQGSRNVHIRNGVGILPDGKLLFIMTKEKINFYDFATLFKEQGCKNALYLDGFVSRTYLPSKNWKQLDGNFGVIIGEVAEFRGRLNDN